MTNTDWEKNSLSLKLGDREISLSTGGFASQADGAVIARSGGTILLATVVMGGSREDLGYFPLQVEYVERLYAGGRIKGSRWVKREGRASDESVLNARLVDRAIRPLFPQGFYNEVQVILTLLSIDHENDPSCLALVAASAALTLSGIPWNGPVAGVKVGLKDGKPFVNPLESEKEDSSLKLTVACSNQGVVMLEAGGQQVTEEDMFNSIMFGKTESSKLLKFIQDFGSKYGKKPLPFVTVYPKPEELKEIESAVGAKIKEIVAVFGAGEDDRESLKELIQEAKDSLSTTIKPLAIDLGVRSLFKKALRKRILEGSRPDGRKVDQIRPIWGKVGILDRTHGSAVFSRGNTQAMTVTTLGAPSLKQLIESAEGEEIKRYIHHYFMPGYSVGEVGRFGWPKRREIGHGALAEKALLPVIPSEDKFPYTIRLVSEILSSNGSTSMASVCGSTISLMDAGVPITDPVAGISVGMVREESRYQLLTDIAGIEDFNGDMDFKVAGTKNGITAIQLDIKADGLSDEVVKETLEIARLARLKILKKMLSVIPAPRKNISQWAPKISLIHIPPASIGELIGPGGKMIRKISEETDTQLDVDDDGTVSVTGLKQEMVDKAIEQVNALTRQPQPGETFEGEVKRLQPFGAFVEVLPRKEGMIHVSDLADGFVKDPSEFLKVGQKIKVVVKEIDDAGRINLKPETPFKANPSAPQQHRPPSRSFSPAPSFKRVPRVGFGRQPGHQQNPSASRRPMAGTGLRTRVNRPQRRGR